MTARDSTTRVRARTPGAEGDPSTKAVHHRALGPTLCGTTEAVTRCTNGGCKPNSNQCSEGAGLRWVMLGKAPPDMPAFQPYRGNPAVRNDREGRGNVGII